jgi:hypothetical protein
MEINKPKSKITTISLILLISAMLLAVAPPTSAHDPPWTVPTFAYVSVSPTTIGVGQQALIVMWLNTYPPTASGPYGDRWKGYTVDITKPDGSKQSLGPFTSDPVGSYYSGFAPDQVGVYKFVFSFPGQKVTGEPFPPEGVPQFGTVSINDTYSPSTSQPAYLTVQQEKIPEYQDTPLPTGYWERPIYGANRLWYNAAGNWLAGAAQTNGATTNYAYGSAPESPHILWARPYWSGGIMDTRTGDIGYYTGMSYESYGTPIIIMEGKLWYAVQTPPRYGYYCVDLYTGQTVYFQNTTGPVSGARSGSGFNPSGSIPYGIPSFGQIYNYDSPNQHGGFPYFWVTNTGKSNTWDMYDAFTGNYICSINNTNLASGTAVYGKDGSILRYNIRNLGTSANPDYHLQVWNTSQAIWYDSVIVGSGSTMAGTILWTWRPHLNFTFDGRNGYSLDVPTINIAGAGSIRAVREDQFIIGGSPGSNNEDGITKGQIWCISLEKGKEGTLLWNQTFTPPSSAGNLSISMGTVDPEDGVFFFEESKTLRRWGYSLDGTMLWGPSQPEAQWNYYGMSDTIYDGKLLSYGYGGTLLAYNVTTGNIIWNWTSGSIGTETPYGNAPLSMGTVADGKLYLYSTEHSPTMPLRRDAFLWCVNATDGNLIWKIQCWASGPKIADGRLVVLDSFDNQIYCYGKGPSATTIYIQNDVVTEGNTVLLKGTVTDQSPSGKLNTNYDLNMPLKDTPAISDADMEAWMEYLFQQRPIPQDATGVPVHLTAIDPNGNYQDIGTTTSDIAGNYALSWTPPVPGTYQATATFEGSASYGSSFGTTYFTVTPKTAASPELTTPPPVIPTETTTPLQTPSQSTSASPTPFVTNAPNPTSQSPTTTYIAIGIAVIVIVAAAAAIILRKRK